jgi:hypothetical protein
VSRRQRRPVESAWQHREYRHKVTLADFYAARLNAIAVPWGSFEAARLMGAPVSLPDRTPTRERIKLDARKLATRCRKFLTLGTEYAARETFAKRRDGPWPCTVRVGPGAVNMAQWPGPGRARIVQCDATMRAAA